MTATGIPLFPLSTVLFPGGRLPLRIFERRYLDMISDCSAAGECFGICLRRGEGAENPVQEGQIGTLARISDFATLEDGLLGVTVVGESRFTIHETWRTDSGLWRAGVQLRDEVGATMVPASYSVLSLLASRFMEQAGHLYPDFVPANLDDASWVGYRLSELLPLTGEEKEHSLAFSDPLERLRWLTEVLPRFQ